MGGQKCLQPGVWEKWASAGGKRPSSPPPAAHTSVSPSTDPNGDAAARRDRRIRWGSEGDRHFTSTTQKASERKNGDLGFIRPTPSGHPKVLLSHGDGSPGRRGACVQGTKRQPKRTRPATQPKAILRAIRTSERTGQQRRAAGTSAREGMATVPSPPGHTQTPHHCGDSKPRPDVGGGQGSPGRLTPSGKVKSRASTRTGPAQPLPAQRPRSAPRGSRARRAQPSRLTGLPRQDLQPETR